MMSQVARQLGAGRVIGTVRRAAQIEQASRYGYDLVVPSEDFGAALAGNGIGTVDVFVGGNELWLSNTAVLGLNIGGLLERHPERGRATAQRALSMLAAGAITVDYSTMPLERAAEAHRRLEAGGLDARIVLTVR